jgi:hypothetical protein
MKVKIKTCGEYKVPIKGKKSLEKLMKSIGGDVIDNDGKHRFKAIYQGNSCPVGKTTDYRKHFVPWLRKVWGEYNPNYAMQILNINYA